MYIIYTLLYYTHGSTSTGPVYRYNDKHWCSLMESVQKTIRTVSLQQEQCTGAMINIAAV